MWFSLAEQTAYFLWSIVLGIGMAVVYDLLRAARMLLRCTRASVLVTDVLFFFVCGVLTSLFALPFNKGDVRGFIIFGEAVGFLLYRLTLGSIFGKFYAVIARLLRHFIRKICEKVKKFYDFLLKFGAFVLYNIVALIDRIRRAALSGVRTLCTEAHDAAVMKRRRKRKRRESRRTNAQEQPGRRRETAYYAIPLRGDPFDTIGMKHEQEMDQAPARRQKSRKRRPSR